MHKIAFDENNVFNCVLVHAQGDPVGPRIDE